MERRLVQGQTYRKLDMPIKVLQANVGRAYAAQDMAYATATQRSIDVLVVGEPNRKRVSDDIWIKDSRVSVAVLLLTRNLDVIGHKTGNGFVTLNLKGISFTCCYISPNIPLLDYKKEVDNIMATLDANTQTVILGDFNAKSPQWGSPVTDEKGEYWMEWIAARDMAVHNTGLLPTFIRGETRSYIDVTISTDRIAKDITNWEVLKTETLTEHQYISFEIEGRTPKKRGGVTQKEVNWEVFKETLEIAGHAIEDANYNNCAKLIRQALQNSVKQCSVRKKHPYWWTEDISRKRAECIRARREQTRLSRRGVDGRNIGVNREAYRTKKRELVKLIKTTKRRFWKKFCEELENDIWGGAYKTVLKKGKCLTPYETSIDQRRKIIADLFPQATDNWKREPTVGHVEHFSEAEISAAAANIKSGKSPGIDGIPPEAIKLAAICIPKLLTDAMNSLLDLQEFPEEWKVAKVVLIPKSGKPPELTTSFRPVCLLNTLSKLLETLIRDRLEKELEEKGGLHEHQYGFRKGRSTVQAVETVLETAKKEYGAKWCTLVTVDVRNAFNSACHSLIIKELRDRRISQYIINFVSSYLTGRGVEVKKNEIVKASAGVPQGSVLGPTLWNVLYDGILGMELTENAMCVGFADDLALVVGANDEYTLMTNTNDCLGRISNWLKNHKMALAPHKTEAIIIRGRRRRDHVTFMLEGVRVTPKKLLNYLGILVDERGSFGPHVINACSKAEEKVAKLNKIMPNIGGPSSCKRAVLSGAIHSIVLYGAPIWQQAISRKKYREVMERTQRKLLLRVACAYRTVSLAALQVITGITPIDLMVQERTFMHEHRQEDRKAVTRVTKLNTERAWQNRWENTVEKAQWTKRLIGNIKDWVSCNHRKVDYFLTQALTAHGAYRAFAKRIQKDDSDDCIYCGETDTAEHTLFQCERWHAIRAIAHTKLKCRTTPENLIQLMLETPENWQALHNMIRSIMQRKEQDELQRQQFATRTGR